MKKNGRAARKNHAIRNRVSRLTIEPECLKCQKTAASSKGVHGRTRPSAPLQADKGEPGVQWPNCRAASSSPIILLSRSDQRWRMASGHGRHTAARSSNPNTMCHQLRARNVAGREMAIEASAPAAKERK